MSVIFTFTEKPAWGYKLNTEESRSPHGSNSIIDKFRLNRQTAQKTTASMSLIP